MHRLKQDISAVFEKYDDGEMTIAECVMSISKICELERVRLLAGYESHINIISKHIATMKGE
jgi:hypothetical protein